MIKETIAKSLIAKDEERESGKRGVAAVESKKTLKSSR
jgi:hypothetical protein